jgi:CspA family cold shock protein
MLVMRGTIKWFNVQKGYGFITDSEGRDLFVHYSNLVMDGFKALNEDDIVNFELGSGKDGREQAINIKPIITTKMVEDSLRAENLYIQIMKDGYGVTKYLVVDEDGMIQTDEQGMDFLNLAAFAGYDIEGL